MKFKTKFFFFGIIIQLILTVDKKKKLKHRNLNFPSLPSVN